jgi:hypothetical protein
VTRRARDRARPAVETWRPPAPATSPTSSGDRFRRLRVTIIRGVVVSLRRRHRLLRSRWSAFLTEREADPPAPRGPAASPRPSRPPVPRRAGRLPGAAASRPRDGRAGRRRSRVSRVGADDGDELGRARRARPPPTPAMLRPGSARARGGARGALAGTPALGVSPARITIRDTTSRWGGCSDRRPVVQLASSRRRRP